MHKLSPPWEGPFVVSKNLNNRSYYLSVSKPADLFLQLQVGGQAVFGGQLGATTPCLPGLHGYGLLFYIICTSSKVYTS